jgi:predicted ferric reductase
MLSLGSVSVPLVTTLAAATGDSNTTTWYLTRATATAAYVVLAVLVSLGLLRSTARISGGRISWVVDEVHQFLGTAFGVLVGLHLLTLLLDPFILFTPVNFILPINEPYSPLAVSFGVVALWTTIVILASSWLRRHLPYRFWRLLHYAGFATFTLVTLHGLFAGSDTSTFWATAMYGCSAAVISFLVLRRLLTRFGNTTMARERA